MPKVKLTDADVRGLCYARNIEGAPLRWLAENYGVSMAQVSRVTRGLQRRDKKMDWEWGPMPATPLEARDIPITVQEFRNARKILQAAGVNPMVDARYIVAEVSSHEETPEVGKKYSFEKTAESVSRWLNQTYGEAAVKEMCERVEVGNWVAGTEVADIFRGSLPKLKQDL